MTIERITKTHAELEHGLTTFGNALRALAASEQRAAALAEVEFELTALRELVEQHIESETQLEERSDSILGEGSMREYGIPAHHAKLRRAVEALQLTLVGDDADEILRVHFNRFVEQFELYTVVELEFLQSNAGVLYPGGSNS